MLIDAAEFVSRVVDMANRGLLTDAEDLANFPGGLAFHGPA